jgi:hypothetical protein
VQDFIEMRKFDDFNLKSIRELKNFDGKYKLDDFYEFT